MFLLREDFNKGVKRKLENPEGEDVEVSVEGIFDLIEQWVCEVKAAFEARENDWDPIWDDFGEYFREPDLSHQPGSQIYPTRAPGKILKASSKQHWEGRRPGV